MKITEEKLAEICFHCGNFYETSGDWKMISYNLEELNDKKYIVIIPVWSREMGYKIKGENDLDIVKEEILLFEKRKEEEEEEGVEVFDVAENKFLSYDIEEEKKMRIKWVGYV